MRKLSTALFGALTVAALGACDLEIGDLNNPSIDEIETNPTRSSISAASVGIMAGHRIGMAAANGYIMLLGMLGREAYNFDNADPRYCGEVLAGSLAKGSPFGGNFWNAPYANIYQATSVIKGVDKVASFSAEERSAVKGYARTFIAMDLLRVINTRDTIGAVIDTDRPIDGALGPIVDKPQVFDKIAELLDQAKTELNAGGMAFPFPLPAGFAGFSTPASFLKFNRAIRARAAVYDADYAAANAALAESFLDETKAATLPELNVGPSMVFSANSGDARNLLTNVNIWVHMDLVTDAQLKTDNQPDNRLTRKTAAPTMAPMTGANCGLSSTRKFTAYTAATSSVPLIRHEELFLLRAETRLKTGQKDAAMADLNRLRQVSGGLATKDPAVMTEAEVETELLYNRRYSLMFEGGHRWIDARRLRLSELKTALPNHVVNVRFPIPQGECDARPGEEKCNIGSR